MTYFIQVNLQFIERKVAFFILALFASVLHGQSSPKLLGGLSISGSEIIFGNSFDESVKPQINSKVLAPSLDLGFYKSKFLYSIAITSLGSQSYQDTINIDIGQQNPRILHKKKFLSSTIFTISVGHRLINAQSFDIFGIVGFSIGKSRTSHANNSVGLSYRSDATGNDTFIYLVSKYEKDVLNYSPIINFGILSNVNLLQNRLFMVGKLQYWKNIKTVPITLFNHLSFDIGLSYNFLDK